MLNTSLLPVSHPDTIPCPPLFPEPPVSEVRLSVVPEAPLSTEAFEEFVRQNRQKLLHLAFRRSGSWDRAEDILQTSLLRMWAGLATFDGRAKLLTWACRIVCNEACNAKRKACGNTGTEPREYAASPALDVMPATTDPHRAAVVQEEFTDLCEAVEGLRRSKLREVVVQVFVEEVSYDEAAAQLGETRAVIARRINQARAALIEEMTAKGHDVSKRKSVAETARELGLGYRQVLYRLGRGQRVA